MVCRICLSALALILALAGCGGGGADGPGVGLVAFAGKAPYTTNLALTNLSGTAFVPRGASCTYYSGPWAPAGCSCDSGTLASGQWTNETNGSSGALELHIVYIGSCTPGETWWRALDVPFLPGTNQITVKLSDGTTQGSTSVTVVRSD